VPLLEETVTVMSSKIHVFQKDS